MAIRSCVFALLAGSLAAACAHAATTDAASSVPVVDLAPVTVSGVLPGPKLWKISKGDHVMWLLGTTSPLPEKMQWESGYVERLIASSQQVLKPPRMEVGAQVGFWGKLALIPSMIGLKKLPEGETLKEVLPPEIYGRWLVQKTKYLGNGSGVERLRPMFAGKALYEAALDRSGLADDDSVEKIVYDAASRNKIKVTDTSYVVVLEDPRGAAKQFKKVTLDDQRCLGDILDATAQDLSQATVRANAWATGDMQALRKVLSVKQQDDCLSALGDTDFGKKVGMTDIAGRIRQAWIKSAEAALDQDRQSLALLPMEQVLSSDGYLASLQAAGYVVQAPVE